jgi:ribosomal protein S18 acetylase RimI-like enzyme
LSYKLVLSLDKDMLDINKIHHYIANKSYWGKGRTLEQVKTSIDKTICFGVYLHDEQVAFARVSSDTVVFAYLLDVIVFEEHQGKGIGKYLLDEVLNHHEFKTVSWLLRTSDAQGLYEKFGFSSIDTPKSYMKKSSSTDINI